MKTITSILFVLVANTFIFAQFTGKVTDKKGESIAFANIIAYNQNKMITGAISDDKGTFLIDPKTENCHLKISFIGFKTVKITPTKSDLGTIVLEEKATTLDKVTITARKKTVQQKIDRLVFNLGNTIASKGGTAIDALKDTPMVNVDSDDLSIIGKGSVRVLINERMVQLSGKELTTYLSSIPSDNIKKIEVITTPPAKYDAEGNAGLINIVLKKARKNSWSNQVRASYIQGFYPFFTFGNTFNYNKDKLSFSASVTKKNGQAYYRYKGTIDYPDTPWKSGFEEKTEVDKFASNFNIDYKISKKATIGLVYSNSFADDDHITDGKSTIYDGKGSYLDLNGFNNNQKRTIP